MTFAIVSKLKWSFNGEFTYIHGFRSPMLFSTSVVSKDRTTNPPPMVDYLVKSAGFSEEAAAAIITKVSHLSKSTAKQPELVVDFLKSSGFKETHIRRLLTFVPGLLRCNVEKTLAPKIRVLQELGLSGSDLGLLVSNYPQMLHRSLKSHILPSLEMLKSLIGSNEQLVSVLLRTTSRQLLSCNVYKNAPHSLQLLKSYGVPSRQIKQMILNRPLLLMHTTQWLEMKVKAVEEKLGIPPTSPMFIHGVSALSSASEDKLESLLRVYYSYGWSKTEISVLLKKHPLSLNMSEKMLRDKLKYFIEVLGFGSDYLATHSVLLSLSMEKRILPRVAIRQTLMDRGLLKRRISVFSCLVLAESKFMANFVLPYKENLPDLYENYDLATSYTLSKT